jgi:thioredoxin 2
VFSRLNESFRCGKCQNELRPPDEPLEADSEAAFNAVTQQSPVPVLVDFWAAWCGPCKMVTPELVKVARNGSGRWVIVKVETELLPSIAARYRISAIPTLVLLQGGNEVARQSGALPARAIEQFIATAATT